jgi:CheY-like chemotaxis protein
MRILIVDDEPAMHDSYRRGFVGQQSSGGGSLGKMTPAVSASAKVAASDASDHAEDEFGLMPEFALTHSDQGIDAVDAVARSLADDDPFAVAFIDVRMPPGIDGRETAKRIRALDPHIHIVIVTGFSDFSPREISQVAGPADKVFYIAKPFEVGEITQTATALGLRWKNDREQMASRDRIDRIDALVAVRQRELGHQAELVFGMVGRIGRGHLSGSRHCRERKSCNPHRHA